MSIRQMVWRTKYANSPGKFAREMTAQQRIVYNAARGAVKDAADATVRAGRSAIGSAGFSSAWQRSLRAKMLTGPDVIDNPKAWVHSTINFADVFETGKTISGSLLWLPLPSVPNWPGARPPRKMSPKKFIEMVGPLRTIRRPGKRPLLGAVVRMTAKAQPWGKFAGKSALPKRGKFSGAALKRSEQLIPMFVGVSSVRIEARFNISEIARREGQKIGQYYDARMGRAAANALAKENSNGD